jgi:GAF domain-containing protein
MLCRHLKVDECSQTGGPVSKVRLDRRRAAEEVPDVSDAPFAKLQDALGELPDLARSAGRAAERQRALLQASAAIASELDLPAVLNRIVAAARDLAEARYAALGLIGIDDGLELFVHTGMDEATVEMIGHLPTGHGLLGELIHHPSALRLENLADHASSIGFPAGHPPMGTFLGVPIRVGNRMYGNLYLTESVNGVFSDDDEQLVAALAASAGLAIENARLYDHSRRQREWLAASAAVTQALFTVHSEAPLDSVVRYASQGADAEFSSVTLANSEGEWQLRATTSFGRKNPTGGTVDARDPLIQRVAEASAAIVVADYAAVFGMSDFIDEDIGAAIGVPLRVGTDVVGALTVARRAGRPHFSTDDVAQLGDFGNYVMAAIELDRSRAATEAARIIEDHGRIAADLHDHVIQALFATGMGLQGIASTLSRDEQRTQVIGYVDILDDTIKRIRSTIFDLSTRAPRPQTIQRRLLEVLNEEETALGFAPHITFAGSLNSLDDERLADDVLAVTREGLSNIARHAGATEAWISVSVERELLTVAIADDGIGPATSSRRSGLDNLHKRGLSRGGALVLSARDGGGSNLCWTAQLGSAHD